MSAFTLGYILIAAFAVVMLIMIIKDRHKGI